MNRLQERMAKNEQEYRRKVIQVTLFTLDYYLMELFMAQEKGCVEEVEESKKMISEIRKELFRLGHYTQVV